LENLLERSDLTLRQLEAVPLQLLGLHHINEDLLHLDLILVTHYKASVLLFHHLFHLRDIFENPIIDMLLLIESRFNKKYLLYLVQGRQEIFV
jgi:hypothetical protein